jgi:hypothetical protein
MKSEKQFKIGDKVMYMGAIMSRNSEYVRARTGKIVEIKGNEATIKALDGSTFHCELKGLTHA